MTNLYSLDPNIHMASLTTSKISKGGYNLGFSKVIFLQGVSFDPFYIFGEILRDLWGSKLRPRCIIASYQSHHLHVSILLDKVILVMRHQSLEIKTFSKDQAWSYDQP